MFTYKLITNEKDVDLKRSTKRSKSNKTLEFIQDRIYIPFHFIKDAIKEIEEDMKDPLFLLHFDDYAEITFTPKEEILEEYEKDLERSVKSLNIWTQVLDGGRPFKLNCQSYTIEEVEQAIDKDEKDIIELQEYIDYLKKGGEKEVKDEYNKSLPIDEDDLKDKIEITTTNSRSTIRNRDTKETLKIVNKPKPKTGFITKEQIAEYEETTKQLEELTKNKLDLEKEIQDFFTKQFYEDFPEYVGRVSDIATIANKKEVTLSATIKTMYDEEYKLDRILVKYIVTNREVLKTEERYTDHKGNIVHKKFNVGRR